MFVFNDRKTKKVKVWMKRLKNSHFHNSFECKSTINKFGTKHMTYGSTQLSFFPKLSKFVKKDNRN